MIIDQLKSILITITFSILVFNDTYSQDLLDGVKSDSKLIVELKDAYRAFHINNIIIEQKEMIIIFSDDTEIIKILDIFIKECDSLKTISFEDKILKSHISKYLTSTIQNYKIAQSKGFSSSEFNKDFEKYNKTIKKYMDYLYATYSTNHFISMSEEEYWQKNNKSNYIKSPDYAKYKNLNTNKLQDAVLLLDTISKETNDFQEYSVYQIEIADQYVKNANSFGENAYEIAIEKYKEILDQKKYSIYLFEAWLKWRLVKQQHVHGTLIANSSYIDHLIPV